MDKYTKKCYIRCWRKNKTPAAHLLEMLPALPLCYIMASLLFRELGFARPSAAILSVCATLILLIVFILVSQIRFERFVKRERKRIMNELCMRAALFMSESEFMELAMTLHENADSSSKVFVFQNQRSLNADDILHLYRNIKSTRLHDIFIVTLSELDESARKCIDCIDNISIDVAEPEQVLTLINTKLKLTDETLDEEFVQQYEKIHIRKTFFEKLTSARRISPYLICGVCLFVLSLILRYSLYYKLLAALCLWICLILAFLKKRQS